MSGIRFQLWRGVGGQVRTPIRPRTTINSWRRQPCESERVLPQEREVGVGNQQERLIGGNGESP